MAADTCLRNPLGSFGSHYGDKCIRTRWNPKLEINKNIKTAKMPTDNQKDRWMDILYCHSGDSNPWTAAVCAVHNYGTGFYDYQKVTWTTRQRDRQRYRQTYNLDWTPVWGESV